MVTAASEETTMNSRITILTILGSPQYKKSNTRALVEDFIEEMEQAGLTLDHQVISLASKKVLPCLGCWSCTRENPCPVSKRDDLEEIKRAMLDCDMLILASPVYENNVTAQMKALFDRLFTWCHVFPLMGKYSLSACTTGSDGFNETGAFLEKMLATYGTFSFGTIHSTGAFQSGEFPRRALARKRNARLAKRIARIVNQRKSLPVSRLQKRMFKTMRRKMVGIHTLNAIRYGHIDGQPQPPWLLRKILSRKFSKMKVTKEQLTRWAANMPFEYDWWKSHGWLQAKSFQDLAWMEAPPDFDVRQRLLLAESCQTEGVANV